MTFIKFTTSNVVNSEECHDTVDDQESVLIVDEKLGDFVQKLHLMFRIDCSGISDVVLG